MKWLFRNAQAFSELPNEPHVSCHPADFASNHCSVARTEQYPSQHHIPKGSRLCSLSAARREPTVTRWAAIQSVVGPTLLMAMLRVRNASVENSRHTTCPRRHADTGHGTRTGQGLTRPCKDRLRAAGDDPLHAYAADASKGYPRHATCTALAASAKDQVPPLPAGSPVQPFHVFDFYCAAPTLCSLGLRRASDSSTGAGRVGPGSLLE